FAPASSEREHLRNASIPAVQAAPTPNVPQPAADLTRVVGTRVATPPTPTPVVRTGTPIMAADARTGVTRPSGLTMQLRQAGAESLDLQASPTWFNRPVEFKVVQHMHRNEAGIEALLDWSTYLTGTGEAATARSVAVDAFGNSYTTGWLEIEG